MAEIPSLNTFYTKTMQDTMSFAMVAIESQSSGMDRVSQVVAENNIVYPVAVSGGVQGYAGGGIPARIVFDHTGKMILQEKGAMNGGTIKAIEEAIAAAPHPLTTDYPFKKLAKEAMMIQKGQNWGKVLKKLREIKADEGADAEEKNEASIIYPLLAGHADKLVARAEAMAAENPVIAAEKYGEIIKLFKGDDIEDIVDAKLKELTSDKTFKVEQVSWGNWTKIEEMFKKYGLKNKSKNKEMLQGCMMLEAKFDGTAGARKASELKPKLEAALAETGGGGDR